MYIGSAQALIEKKLNQMDMINESFVAFITFFSIVFTDFV